MASFLIVAGVLGLGWLAYERRRPSARMAAVVAVMAALAALGRDAFAALPDVKPITAMTFVVGYSLGPLAGFTVGALGMLVSNFMLGQGPYTPWQMAAWGMVGLAGAAVGRVSRGRLGRVPLALGCAASALAAKEVMNLYTWTLGASHTPAAFLAVAAQAVPYDITDTIASFLFGLAFAAELARVLSRTRDRMEVTWEDPLPASHAEAAAASGGEEAAAAGAGRLAPARRWALLGAAACLAGLAIAAVSVLGDSHTAGARAERSQPTGPGPPGGGGAPRGQARAARLAVSREVAFLAAAQNTDGGFGGARGQATTELYSAWAAIGLAAAGRNPLSMRRDGHTVLDALRSEAGSLQGAGDLERTILALRACGASVHVLPGGDPVARLLLTRSADGSFGDLGNLTAFGILALRAAGYSPASPPVRGAERWLAAQQDRDGGFGFATAGGQSDVDDTAAVVQALASAGPRRARAIIRATAYLVRAQNLDGGFPQEPGGESNAQSTSWAVQALTAAGRDASTLSRSGSRSPVGYLESLLAPDGSVRYSRTGSQTPVWVTAQALTALAARPFPIAPSSRSAGV